MTMSRWIAVAALPLLTACAPLGGSGKPRPERPAAALEVRNDNWNAVDVFLERSGTAYRLGMVETGQTMRFRLPADLALAGSDVSFVADPIGATDAYRTDAVLVNPGDRVSLFVGNVLGQSWYRIESD